MDVSAKESGEIENQNDTDSIPPRSINSKTKPKAQTTDILGDLIVKTLIAMLLRNE